MSERTTSAAWVRGIIESLASAGFDARSICAEAGIDFAALDDPAGRVATERVSRLWQVTVSRAGDPGIVLALAATTRPSKFEVVGYAMMSSANLRTGLGRLVRYLRILSEAAAIELGDSGATCRVELELFGGREPVPGERYAYDLLALLNLCRWIAGREASAQLQPLQVELGLTQPPQPQRWRDAFGCALRFGAPRNSLVFSSDDLATPLPAANPTLAALHDRLAGDHIQRLDQARLSVRAREAIIRSLPDGEPKREAVAKTLAISEKTLQRRLLEEGASFQRLLDDTRRELAERYLGQANVSFAQAAYLLGFADQGIFTRACKRWFALTPGQYRQRQEGQAQLGR
jgi:AraC-like DNA-binding protein